MTWCVKKVQLVPVEQQIFHVCPDVRLWIVLSTLAISCIAFAYWLQQFETFKWTAIRIFFIGIAHMSANVFPYHPKNNTHRVLYLIFALACVIGSIVFNTFILKAVTDPYVKREIRSIDDILTNDIKLAGDRYALSQVNLQQMVEII